MKPVALRQATAKGANPALADRHGWTALHHACKNQDAELAAVLLAAGSCRFVQEAAPCDTRRPPLDLAAGSKAVRAVFLSCVDYWQRRRHGGHSWAMKRVVLAMMLVRQRLDARPRAPSPSSAAGPARALPAAHAAAAPPSCLQRERPAARCLVHLPEEVWLLMCAFLRGADFPTRAGK